MARRGGLRRQLPAGIVDSGFASLAGFAVALTAVNVFDDVDRGVYAIFFTAFVMGALLANELIFTPAEVEAVSVPVPARLSLVPQSLRLGIGPAMIGALASPIAVAVTAGYASRDVVVGLALTAAAAMIVSPMQDHVRRMLHIAELSWRAAAVSVVQFVAVLIAIGGFLVADVPEQWVPFGALTIANVVSLTTARILAQQGIEQHAEQPLRFLPLARTGVWFVLNAAPAVLWFAASAIIAALASPEALGYAESARVVAQPILVVAAGLKVVLAPRAMRAAMDLDPTVARRIRRTFYVAMALCGLGYLLITGWDWALNPMSRIVPSAYTLSGLVAATVLANVATTAAFLQGDELAGARRVKTLAGISWVAGVFGLVGAFTAAVTDAFARPLSLAMAGGLRYVAQGRALVRVYGAGADKPVPTDPG